MQVVRMYDTSFFGPSSHVDIPKDGVLHDLPGGGKVRFGFSQPTRIFDANSPRYGREFNAEDAMRQTAMS